MIRLICLNGFIKAAKTKWETFGKKDTFEVITDDRALELQEKIL